MTIPETTNWFNSIYEINRINKEGKSDFCCGLTEDINKTKADLHINSFLGVTKCDSFDTATTLINLMKEEGYSIGPDSNKENKDSAYVYLIKKKQPLKF